MDELKTCCITPEQLWTAGEESGGGEGDKLRDLSLIYGAYEAMTARQGADPRDRLTRLAEALTREDWAVGKDFYLDAFTDFTPQDGQCSPPCWGRPIPSPWPSPATSWRRTRGARDLFPRPAAPPASSSGWPRSGAFSREIEVRAGGAGPKTAALAHLEGQLFAPPARPL